MPINKFKYLGPEIFGMVPKKNWFHNGALKFQRSDFDTNFVTCGFEPSLASLCSGEECRPQGLVIDIFLMYFGSPQYQKCKMRQF